MNVSLVKWATTSEVVLAHAYLEGEKIGTLAFPIAVWVRIVRRESVELFLAEPVSL